MAIKQVGLFCYSRVISNQLIERLKGFSVFSFPTRYFIDIDCGGRTPAVSTEYFKGKPARRIIFASARILRHDVKLAIAVASDKLTTILLSAYNGHKNLIVTPYFMKIERTVELPAANQDPQKRQPPVKLGLPDFGYIPFEPPHKKGTVLKPLERKYVRWLIWFTEKYRNRLQANFLKKSMLSTAIESLIRSNPARIDRLVAWGMLTPEDAAALENRSYYVSPERICKMLIWFTAEHIALGELSQTRLDLALTKLVPHFYVEYLKERFKGQPINLHDIWYFIRHSQPEQEIASMLDDTERLTREHSLSRAEGKYFAKHHPINPDNKIAKVRLNAEQLEEEKEVNSPTAYSFAKAYVKPGEAFSRAITKFKLFSAMLQYRQLAAREIWETCINHPKHTEMALNSLLQERSDGNKDR